jgi:hypothetical protein
MVHQLFRLALIAASIPALSVAQADDTNWALSGFATLGAVRSDTDLGTFVIPGQTSGARRNFNFEVDSKIGVQSTYKLDSQLSATAQLIAKHNGDGNWNPQPEWLFGKYQASPNLSLRVGRVGLPAFAVSEFRDVNYANLWLRPPLDVYGQVPFSHLDGADVIWQIPLGGASLTAQVLGGQTSSAFQQRRLEASSLAGVNATADLGNGIRLRFGHIQTKLSVVENTVFPQLLGGLEMAGFGRLAEQINPTKKASSFSGLGFSYEEGKWVLLAEHTMRRTQSYVSDTTGWFATVGHRFGNVTPYVTVGERKVNDSNIDNTIPVTPIPELELLRQTVDGLIAGQSIGQKTTALGLRWDAGRNCAVKIQLERVRASASPGIYPAGQFIGLKPGFQGATLLGISVDILF